MTNILTSKQEIFDHVVASLAAQGKRAIAMIPDKYSGGEPIPQCMYRTDTGEKCAAGHCIPDDRREIISANEGVDQSPGNLRLRGRETGGAGSTGFELWHLCVSGGFDNTKCALGHLMPDDRYNNSLEGSTMGTPRINSVFQNGKKKRDRLSENCRSRMTWPTSVIQVIIRGKTCGVTMA